MDCRKKIWMAFLLVVVFSFLFPQPAAAYIGPGVGMSAIGTFLAIVAGIFIAILGFLWYPVKRLLRKLKKDTPEAPAICTCEDQVNKQNMDEGKPQ